ncbi:hypothetical protein AK830_g4043 [Neonectria ditissima]|uniref:SnoaL-like domain-containing protein n=1 Tax=Neonectria ditissima TaxID=78410 RepID=A0A0P7BP73_9HYPO|nr:hypothetical protein AK830_g4043 [Neonectria ditissima]
MAASPTPTSRDIKKNIEATFTDFIAAYKDGAKQNDPAIINRNVTADCTRHLLPTSLLKALGAPQDFVIDNAEYERLFAVDLQVGGVQEFTISNLVIDAEDRKAAATTLAKMVFKNGEELVMEHSWFVDFTEDGTKVKKVVEFCDGESVHKLMAEVKKTETDGKGAE